MRRMSCRAAAMIRHGGGHQQDARQRKLGRLWPPLPAGAAPRERNHLPRRLVDVWLQRHGAGRMQFDNSKSGDHLERGWDAQEAVVANIPERQGVTGHHVRYVLLFGIAAAVIAFAILLAVFLS